MPDTKSKTIKLAMIGLDTSHSIVFAQRIQGPRDNPQQIYVDGMQITRCLRFASPFQSEPQQDERQKILESLGIEVSRDLQEVVAGVDGILFEVNDPALHWEYFQQVAELGLPIFIDKPLAKDPADARKILALAKEKNIAVWEASSLRFSENLRDAQQQAGPAKLVNIYGAMGIAAAGSSLIWYGCHTFQMLNQIMGNQARTVQAMQGSRGVVTTVEYPDGRRGVIESIVGIYDYGGRIHGESGIKEFQCEDDVYGKLMRILRDFFCDGVQPITLAESYAVQVMMDAAEQSLQTGKPVHITEPLV